MKKSVFILFLILPPVLITTGLALKWFSLGWTNTFGGFTNVSSAVMAILTYYYVVSTSYYVFLTGRLVQQAVKSQGLALKAQEAEFRPYMVVDIEFEEILGFLVIKNVGRLPALNVHIEFEPHIVATSKAEGKEYGLTEELLSKPFAFFPPGKVQRSNLGPAEEFLSPSQEWVYRVSLSYSWAGKQGAVHEDYVIDLNFERHVGLQRNKGLKEIAESLQRIERRLAGS